MVTATIIANSRHADTGCSKYFIISQISSVEIRVINNCNALWSALWSELPSLIVSIAMTIIIWFMVYNNN